jgi:hypothetical protein
VPSLRTITALVRLLFCMYPPLTAFALTGTALGRRVFGDGAQ